MTNDIDLAADFADDPPEVESPILPPLTELYGDEALPADLDFDAMIATAVDPATPPPAGDLIPESEPYASDEVAATSALDEELLPPELDDDLGFADTHEGLQEDDFHLDDSQEDATDSDFDFDPGV
ncbi:hypothetical protein WG915_08675 [Corynebacterium sp. H128]|uniref:hypothetical protein n=1 Tax=Corynebacterium sp. H128 TaxID=3133427 RepID=UPI003099574F